MGSVGVSSVIGSVLALPYVAHVDEYTCATAPRRGLECVVGIPACAALWELTIDSEKARSLALCAVFSPARTPPADAVTWSAPGAAAGIEHRSRTRRGKRAQPHQVPNAEFVHRLQKDHSVGSDVVVVAVRLRLVEKGRSEARLGRRRQQRCLKLQDAVLSCSAVDPRTIDSPTYAIAAKWITASMWGSAVAKTSNTCNGTESHQCSKLGPPSAVVNAQLPAERDWHTRRRGGDQRSCA